MLEDRSYLDGLPGDGVQVVVAQVQLLQSQEVVECSLVDEHQLVVVQDEVVELGHATERVVAYPGQSVAKGGEMKRGRTFANVQTLWGEGMWNGQSQHLPPLRLIIAVRINLPFGNYLMHKSSNTSRKEKLSFHETSKR